MEKIIGNLEVEIKNVYGEDKVYPFNDTAKLFCELQGTKTLTPKTVSVALRLGYVISVVKNIWNRPAWL